MKARVLTANQRKMIAAVCKEQIEAQLDDATTRCQYLWAMSMLAVGLSPATVNRVKNKLPEVTEKYAEYRTDQIADFAFCSKLQGAGVDVGMTKEEL